MSSSCLGVPGEVARLYAQQGAIDQAVRSCRQILRVEPWWEAVYRWLTEREPKLVGRGDAATWQRLRVSGDRRGAAWPSME